MSESTKKIDQKIDYGKKAHILKTLHKSYSTFIFDYINNRAENNFIFIPPKNLVDNFFTKSFSLHVRHLYKTWKNSFVNYENLYFKLNEQTLNMFLSKNILLEELLENSIMHCLDTHAISVKEYYYSIRKTKISSSDVSNKNYKFFNIKPSIFLDEENNIVNTSYTIYFYEEDLSLYNYMFYIDTREIISLDEFLKVDKFNRYVKGLNLRHKNVKRISPAIPTITLQVELEVSFDLF